MRMCAELADLGMQVARAVATRAVTDWAEPEAPPAAESPPQPATEAAPSRPLRAPGLSVRAPSCKSGDPALIFTRVVASVRECIALEARLAAGLTPTSRATTPARHADPRRARLRHIFGRITEHHPDRAELVRETTARIDEDLAADPDRLLKLPDLFFAICEALGIEPDLATLPDEFLGLADDLDDPHATSPP